MNSEQKTEYPQFNNPKSQNPKVLGLGTERAFWITKKGAKMTNHEAFIAAFCRLGDGENATFQDLFTAWKLWLAETGRTHKGNFGHFARKLRGAVPGGVVVRHDQVGTRPYGEPILRARYFGIGLKDPIEGEKHGVHCAAEA